MKKFKNEQKGVTLIALVITIIVLIILAGVAIGMITGENGIITQAKDAKQQTEKASIEEAIDLAALSAEMSDDPDTVLKQELDKSFGEDGYSITGDAKNGWTVTVGNVVKEIEAIEGIGEQNVIWSYKEDEEGRKTIVTNGEIELPIGTYINYNAAAEDADEKTIVEKTVTSEAGSPTVSGPYSAQEQTVSKGNGHSNQTFSNKATTNGWRVLGVDEEAGEIIIISADPVKTTENKSFYLQGIAGYQYGPDELDKICEVFGEGYGARKARSVDVEDVNKITGYNPNNIGEYDPDNTGSGTKYAEGEMWAYGNEVTYKWNATANKVDSSGTNGQTGSVTDSNYGKYGFNWYDEQAKGWKTSKQNVGTAQDIVTLKSSYYWYYPYSLTTTSSTTGERKGLSTDSDEYKTLFTNKAGTKVSYWLASSVVFADTFCAFFDMRCVFSSGGVYFYYLYDSLGSVYGPSYGVRPAVNLKSDVQLEWNEEKGYYDIVG